MKLIAAVNKNWGIGKDNDLLYHIPGDMKFFRSKTKDNIIIVGRKTLESFPDGKPLKFRTNVVLTTDTNYKADDAVIFNTVDDIVSYVKNHSDKDVYVCGGAQIYNLFLPLCSTAYITKIDDDKDAEKFMTNLDDNPDWKLIEQSETFVENGYSYKFCTYTNLNYK